MLDQVTSDREASPEPVPWRVSARLSAKQQRELLEEYERGATGQELALQYGIARSAVIQFLRSRGATVRRPRLTDEELATVVALYQDGVRQIDIAKRLGRTKGAVWHALRRMGLL